MATIASSWKTTSTGISLIVASVTGLIFAAKNNQLNETTIGAGVTGILGGIGLIFSKDYNVSGNPPVSTDDPTAKVTNPGVKNG